MWREGGATGGWREGVSEGGLHDDTGSLLPCPLMGTAGAHR